MGDLLSNSELFKKLGVDSSNQWILYDEQLEKFFKFLSQDVTDANILTESQVLEREEMRRRNEWLDESDRELKLLQIESESPGLLKFNRQDVSALTMEIASIEEASRDYALLLEDMLNAKHSISNHLSELECAACELQSKERELLGECQSKAKQLEDLQRENCRLSGEAKKSFTTPQMPPLFMHQLPLEQYFLKCDSFMQYFTLYVKENFKIQEYDEFQIAENDVLHEKHKLEDLQNGIQHYALSYIKQKAKAQATQALIDQLDFGQIHCLSLADMAREMHELQLLNEHQLSNVHDTLLNDLTIHVQQHTQRRIELVLYENTKLKLDRAMQRHESDLKLTKIISDALSNAELLWIAIQLDCDKKRNCLDTSEELRNQAQATWQRVQTMRSINSTHQGICGQFIQEIANLLSAHLGHTVKAGEAKPCLYEYEKFGRLLSYSLQSMLNKKSSDSVRDQLDKIKLLEQTLRPYVFDSPIEQPMLENVRYLSAIFNVTQQQSRLDEAVRQLRTDFLQNVSGRMDMDKLWRYSVVLWIWFLTEPQRVLYAIDEVKKASAAQIRPGGGLQRK
ncbi:augmin complex subunit dgt3 [Drosophila bipectinata]|uniref:augmin complex subunit dgt3 n=1 Tax=Drosophila bipectinata TaxID=42026 RepID=UPI001C8A5775|nr:augmin complex subunit dgt3 [Drosophila bipectinata]